MVTPVGRNIAAPLLLLNLVMYLIVLGFASWCVNKYINGQTNHPSNGATPFFLTFSILAAVIGIASKFAGANRIRFFFLFLVILLPLLPWALGDWRKRKMERAKQRDLEKTEGVSSSKTS